MPPAINFRLSLWRIYDLICGSFAPDTRGFARRGHVLATNENVTGLRLVDALRPRRSLVLNSEHEQNTAYRRGRHWSSSSSLLGAWLNLRQRQATPRSGRGGGHGGQRQHRRPVRVDRSHRCAAFTDEDLAGDYALIYFGYTFCPGCLSRPSWVKSPSHSTSWMQRCRSR